MTVEVLRGGQLTKGSADAAGYDLHATDYAIIEPGDRKVIPTGVFVAIPRGSVGFVCSRSGLAAKHGVFVLNAPGVIDADYRGEVQVILANNGEENFVIQPDDRIAQLLFVEVGLSSLLFVKELHKTVRGDGGLGSTGV